MSVNKILPGNNSKPGKNPEKPLRKSRSAKKDHVGSKRRRVDSCFSFNEISLEPAGSSLKDMDSIELKAKIIRWAKAVVAYARQVSGKFGSSRSSDVDMAGNGSSTREDYYKPD